MKLKDNQGNHKIAITGMSSILPGSHNPQQFWENIIKGRNLIKDAPSSHWRIEDYYDPSRKQDMSLYAKTGGFLDPILFDPMEFGMPPNTIPVTDTVQLLALIAARDALNDTKSYINGKVDKKKTSVILGVAAGTESMENMGAKVHWPELLNTLRSNGVQETLAQKIVQETRDSFSVWNENTFPGLLSNVVAGRIANRFDLGGTNSTMDAACASSLTAIKNAMQELQLGNTDMVISGGADALNSIFMYMCFNQTGALSPTGDCRPFDYKGDGTILGEGMVFFTLKRLEDAIEQGDRIYSVLAGIGSSSDGKSKSIYAPDANGQSLSINRAHSNAGTLPSDIELIEAHGTGTVAGDFAEFNGLKLAFCEQQKSQFCALGSIKSQIGHTKSAAGAASLQKVVLSLYNRVIPPTIKVERPNENMQIESSPFYINTLPKPWITAKDVRRAGVSSFGFGGTNFHVIVEEYKREQHKNHYVSGSELLLFSAQDKIALKNTINDLDKHLDFSNLAKFAKEYQLKFDVSAKHRLSIIIDGKQDFLTIKSPLRSLLESDKTSFEIPSKVYYSSEKRQSKLAVICSGQGSQYLNMGRELLNKFPKAFEGYSTTENLCFDDTYLHEVAFPIGTFNNDDTLKQENRLNDTRWAQPAIGNLTIAHQNLLNSIGLEPAMICGHSYGELSALFWSGIIKTPQDFINISRKRGELMASAAKEDGGMTAVFANGKQTEQWLLKAKSTLQVANYNSPNQTVVSGKLEAITQFEMFLSEQEVNFKRLPVSTAFHSTLVANSASDFGKYLNNFGFGKAKIEVFGNLDGKKYKKTKKSIIDSLSNQLKSPVRFTDEIENMYQAGAQVFLEVGPGNNLTGLVKRILAEKRITCVSLDGHKNQDSNTAFWLAIGQLCTAGIALDFNGLWHQFEEFYKKKTDYSSIAVEITGANYQKPYPEKTDIHAPVMTSSINKKLETTLENKRVENKNGFNSNIDKTQPVQIKATQKSILKNNQPLKHSSKPMDKNNKEWTSAFSQIQANMHKSQMEFMRMMVENQNQFLQLSASLLTNKTPSVYTPVTEQVPVLPPIEKTITQQTTPSTIPPLELHTNGHNINTMPTGVSIDTPKQTTVSKQEVIAPKSVELPEIKTEAPEELSSERIQQKLVEIVAEKTGYPAEVLDMEAHLESGLGIDSIKRVQILSALQKEYAVLKDLDSAVLAKMNTLKEIIEYSNNFLNNEKPSTVETTLVAEIDESTSLQTPIQLEKLLLNIVSEHTGYPVEVLDMEAHLESGLGIDSIKRVQILSSLQKEYPELKNADTSKLAKMNTLKEIINYSVEGFEKDVKKKAKSLDMM